MIVVAKADECKDVLHEERDFLKSFVLVILNMISFVINMRALQKKLILVKSFKNLFCMNKNL